MRRSGASLLALVLATAACAHTAVRGGDAFGAGVQAAERGEYAAAIDSFLAVQTRTPHAPEVLFNLGLAHARDGQHVAAIAWFRAYLAVSSDSQVAAQVRAEIERVAARFRVEFDTLAARTLALMDRTPTQDKEIKRGFIAYSTKLVAVVSAPALLRDSLKRASAGPSSAPASDVISQAAEVVSRARADADRGELVAGIRRLQLASDSAAAGSDFLAAATALCLISHAQAQLQDWPGALATIARIRVPPGDGEASDSLIVATERASASAILASVQAEMGADFSATLAQTTPYWAALAYADAAEAAHMIGDTAKTRTYLRDARQRLATLATKADSVDREIEHDDRSEIVGRGSSTDRCEAVGRVAWAAIRVGDSSAARALAEELGTVARGIEYIGHRYTRRCVWGLGSVYAAVYGPSAAQAIRALGLPNNGRDMVDKWLPEDSAEGAMWVHGEVAFWAILARYRFSTDWFENVGETAAFVGKNSPPEYVAGRLTNALDDLAAGYALVRRPARDPNLPVPLHIRGCGTSR